MNMTHETIYKFELTPEERMAFVVVDNVLRLIQDNIENAVSGVIDYETGQLINHHDIGMARGVMGGIMEVDTWYVK